MDAIRDFLEDWGRCVELDPVQHLCTCLVGVTITLLMLLFWASVRGLL